MPRALPLSLPVAPEPAHREREERDSEGREDGQVGEGGGEALPADHQVPRRAASSITCVVEFTAAPRWSCPCPMVR
jgi:hypothetical protein